MKEELDLLPFQQKGFDRKQLKTLSEFKIKEEGVLSYEDVLRNKRKFITTIKAYCIHSVPEEDIFSEFTLKLLRISVKDGLNYLQRWDGKSCSPSSWLYKPLKNLCNTLKTRECTKGGSAITNAASLSTSFDFDDESSQNSLNVNTLLVPSAEEDYSSLVSEQVLKIVKRKYSSFSSKSSKGVERSPYIVLKLLAEEYSRSEIAEILETSTTFVASLIAKIKGDKEILALRTEYFSD